MTDPRFHSMTVRADGEELRLTGGILLTGRESIGFDPCFWQLDLMEPGNGILSLLRRAKRLEILMEGRIRLAAGSIDDLSICYVRGKEACRVIFSEVSGLLNSTVSLTIPAGTRFTDALGPVLAASGSGILPGCLPSGGPILTRSMVFHSGTVRALNILARTTGTVPVLSDGILDLISLRSGHDASARAPILLTENELLDPPGFAGPPGGSPEGIILRITPAGVPLGRPVRAEWDGAVWEGLVVSRFLDLFSGKGAWIEELLLSSASGFAG